MPYKGHWMPGHGETCLERHAKFRLPWRGCGWIFWLHSSQCLSPCPLSCWVWREGTCVHVKGSSNGVLATLVRPRASRVSMQPLCRTGRADTPPQQKPLPRHCPSVDTCGQGSLTWHQLKMENYFRFWLHSSKAAQEGVKFCLWSSEAIRQAHLPQPLDLKRWNVHLKTKCMLFKELAQGSSCGPGYQYYLQYK